MRARVRRVRQEAGGQRKYRVKLDTMSRKQLVVLVVFLIATIALIAIVGSVGPASIETTNPTVLGSGGTTARSRQPCHATLPLFNE